MVPQRGNLIQPRVSEAPQEPSATLGKSPPPESGALKGRHKWAFNITSLFGWGLSHTKIFKPRHVFCPQFHQ